MSVPPDFLIGQVFDRGAGLANETYRDNAVPLPQKRPRHIAALNAGDEDFTEPAQRLLT